MVETHKFYVEKLANGEWKSGLIYLATQGEEDSSPHIDYAAFYELLEAAIGDKSPSGKIYEVEINVIKEVCLDLPEGFSMKRGIDDESTMS